MDRLLEKLKTLDPKVLCAALGVVVLLLVAGDFFLILNPQIGGLLAQRKKNVELRDSIEKLKTDKLHIDQFRKSLSDMKARAANFDRMVYARDNVPAALDNISKFANQYGVKIDQMIPQQQGEEQLVKGGDGTYKSVAIFVSARSGYHEFGRFINRLENDRVIFRVDDLSFAADAMNPQKHLVKVLLRILVLEK